MADGLNASKWVKLEDGTFMMSSPKDYERNLTANAFRSSHDPAFSAPSMQWRINELENALAFYANDANWEVDGRGSFEATKIFNDCGAIAKQALRKK